MVPRAVSMAKAVVDYGVDTETYGNVIGPLMRGWSNRSVNYYTNSISPAIWDPGSPFPAQPCVYGFVENQPWYRWFPLRPSSFWDFETVPVDAIVPGVFSGCPFPPPIGTLDPYLG